MSAVNEPQAAPQIDRLWYTRCNVPTASGIAFNLGRLSERYGRDGMTIGALQDAPLEIARHHYDHLLPGLIREGGNVPALVARSNGSPTRLIGLTFIDEQQIIVAQPESGISGPRELAGHRIAVPAFTGRGETSMARAMALHGFENALALGGLTLADVEIIDVPLEEIVPPGKHRKSTRAVLWPGLDLVERGEADALYLKGAAAGHAAREAGLVVAVDLDAAPGRRWRVNNGTPRPLTVHADLLDRHFDWVVAFLAETLQAADWAAANPQAVQEIVARETQAPLEQVEKTYGADFHRALHPDLSEERLGLLAIQKDFLLRHGFLTRDFDLAGWVAWEPLREAQQLVARGKTLAAE